MLINYHEALSAKLSSQNNVDGIEIQASAFNDYATGYRANCSKVNSSKVAQAAATVLRGQEFFILT